MRGWLIHDREVLEFGGVEDIRVRVAGGHVAVAGSPGPTRCEVRDVVGEQVKVLQEGGSLRVLHPAKVSGSAEVGGQSVSIHLTVPPGARVHVATSTGSVLLGELHGSVSVETGSGDVALRNVGTGVDTDAVGGRIHRDPELARAQRRAS